jgi:hypothetical protein
MAAEAIEAMTRKSKTFSGPTFPDHTAWAGLTPMNRPPGIVR